MINIFIPIVENVEGFCEFISKHKESDKHIYVGIRQSLKDRFSTINDNVEVHVFSDKSNKEEIINGLQKCQRAKGKLLVIRRPLTDDEYVALTTSETEITTLKAYHNKFVAWFKNVVRKTIKRFFAFSYFEDISAICYAEFLHELVCACPNLSVATRINKYVGVDISELVTNTPPVKKDFNKFKNASMLVLGCLILGGAIAGAGCVFAFVSPLRAIFVVLVLAMLFVALVLFGIFIVHFTRTTAVGELEYNAGVETELIPANIKFEEEEVVEEPKPKAQKKTTKNSKTQSKAKKTTSKPKTTAAKAKTTTTTTAKKTGTTKTTKSTKQTSGNKKPAAKSSEKE